MISDLFCATVNDMDKPEIILYNWIFHYNQYNETWNAFPREEYVDYWNGISKNVVSEKTIEACTKKAARKELVKTANV